MAHEDDELDLSDPKTLRERYEATLKENRSLKGEVTEFRATKLITEKGYTLVKPEDLKGVDPSKLDERATALQEERTSLQVELAKDLFAKQGFQGEELEEAVQEFMEGRIPPGRQAREDETARQFERLRSHDQSDYTPASRIDNSKLTGQAAIEAALEKQSRRTR